MKRSTLAIVMTLTASMLTAPLAAHAGGNGNSHGKTNNYSQPKVNPVKSSYTNNTYVPTSANANAWCSSWF